MKDIEIVVFNDKSWVRFTEYQKVKEENEQLRQQIENMKKDVEELKWGSEDVEMFLRTDELLKSWELAE